MGEPGAVAAQAERLVIGEVDAVALYHICELRDITRLYR